MKAKETLRILLIYLSISSFTISFANSNFTAKEIQKIYSLSISQLSEINDPSNQYLKNPDAIAFGKQLFSDKNLSRNKQISCASCHIPEKAFTDNKSIAFGQRKGFRNTPSILNSAQHNWFFADGSKDSLWAQAVSSIENPAEQDFSRVELLHYLAKNPDYKKSYTAIFKHALPEQSMLHKYPEKAGPNANLESLLSWKKMSTSQRQNSNKVVTNIGKAIAAYVSTLASERTRFDKFADELNDKGSSEILSVTEKRGLKLFLSQKSGCINCHNGALFSNKEFHNIGTGIGGKDNGRSEILDTVRFDEFNCLGEYSDAKAEECQELRYMNKNKHSLSGAFKTPSLRNISQTAPYMHDGRYKTLQEVLEHYNKIDVESAATVDLAPIDLNKEKQDAIIQFLNTL